MKALMKSNVSQDKIEKIVINNNSQHFQRIHSREFRYCGKMYDIIKEVKKGSTTTFYCINDKKEEELMESISKYFQTSDDGMTSVKYSGKILKNIFFPLYFESTKLNSEFELAHQNILIFDSICLVNYYDVELPPPKIKNPYNSLI